MPYFPSSGKQFRVTNQVIANIPIGQTTQALVYVPNAAPNGGAEKSDAAR